MALARENDISYAHCSTRDLFRRGRPAVLKGDVAVGYLADG